jgi:tRNA 2-thiocytidine biosynthesis protein TtcA
MLKQWDKIQPGRIDNIARAIKNIAPTQLGDGELVDFKALKSRVELPQFV